MACITVYAFTYMYVCMHRYMCMCTVYIGVCVSVNVYVCMYRYMCMCACIGVCVCVYMYGPSCDSYSYATHVQRPHVQWLKLHGCLQRLFRLNGMKGWYRPVSSDPVYKTSVTCFSLRLITASHVQFNTYLSINVHVHCIYLSIYRAPFDWLSSPGEHWISKGSEGVRLRFSWKCLVPISRGSSDFKQYQYSCTVLYCIYIDWPFLKSSKCTQDHTMERCFPTCVPRNHRVPGGEEKGSLPWEYWIIVSFAWYGVLLHYKSDSAVKTRVQWEDFIQNNF